MTIDDDLPPRPQPRRGNYGPFTVEELDAWFPFIAVTGRLWAMMDARGRQAHGLTMIDMSILVGLMNAPSGKLRMSEIAEYSGAEPSTLTYRIGRMEKLGYAQRVASTEDRRVVYAAITKAGRQKFNEAMPDHVADARTLFLSNLSASDRRAITRIFDRVMLQFEMPIQRPSRED